MDQANIFLQRVKIPHFIIVLHFFLIEIAASLAAVFYI